MSIRSGRSSKNLLGFQNEMKFCNIVTLYLVTIFTSAVPDCIGFKHSFPLDIQTECSVVSHELLMITWFIRAQCRRSSLLKKVKKFYTCSFWYICCLYISLTIKTSVFFIYLNRCRSLYLQIESGCSFYIHNWAFNFLHNWFDFQSRCQQPCDVS